MTKIRKQKRKKVYRYDVNRKRVKNRMKKRPKVTCAPVKAEWDVKKSAIANLSEMGLSYDPNVSIKISNKNGWSTSEVCQKPHVAMELEADAKAPRERKFRLPNSQVYWLTKLLDKYGEDYMGMAKDRKMNYFQETWKQLRAKVKRFKGIPEQYEEYLKKKAEEEESAEVPTNIMEE